MKDHAREKDTAEWLAHEFDGGDGKTPFAVRPESPNGTMLPWPKVQRRIAQLIKEDRFYTEAEQDRFDNIDPIAIREALAERGIVNGQVVDPEKLDSDPFIRQVMRDVEAVATEEQAEAAAKPPVPDLSGQPVTREGDTLTIGSGEPTHEMDIAVSDGEYEAIRQAIPETEAPTASDPATSPYHVGDTVYLDNQEYQITELREDTVQLLPSDMAYPIYRVESRERFETLLRADTRNEAINEFLPVNPDTADQDLRDVLVHGLIGAPDKAELSELLHTGKPNARSPSGWAGPSQASWKRWSWRLATPPTTAPRPKASNWKCWTRRRSGWPCCIFAGMRSRPCCAAVCQSAGRLWAGAGRTGYYR